MVEWIVLGPITAKGHDATPLPGIVEIGGQRTTLHLESVLWTLLRNIAGEKGITLDQLCTTIAQVTKPGAEFAVSARFYAVGHMADQIPDEQLPPEILALRNRRALH